MHAQLLGHLVLIEIKLLARNQQLFSERKFRHVCSELSALSCKLSAINKNVAIESSEPGPVFDQTQTRRE
jgi:hypothetical protein